MNANELADLIGLLESEAKTTARIDDFIKKSAATMLRQQQAEIEALKIKNKALKIMNDGKNKIIEEYEHKYPDFFFMENDLMGKR